MRSEESIKNIDSVRDSCPAKFTSAEVAFKSIRRGCRIFISTGCGEPQHLVDELIKYAQRNPKTVCDAEVYHVWTMGVAPYTQEKFKNNFRHNSFFIGVNTRSAVNQGLADFTPISLSAVPKLFRNGVVPIDVALIQTSPPDSHGYMSLGVSVDIVKAAVEAAGVVIAQVNANMPRIHGDAFIHCGDIDFIVPFDEPLLEYDLKVSDDIVERIGDYVSRLVRDGDTLQVGYGSIPNAILKSLSDKKHLGIHTELLTDGIVSLLEKGVIDNSNKTINRGKTIATFCMGKRSTYQYIDDNPAIEFKTIDYTNNSLIIAQHRNMTAINSALMVDLTGQSSAESIGRTFFSGIGGQADFMRGTILSPNGKTILTLQSTAESGTVSRIVPFLPEGTGVTLNRSDIHYVVTEFGIAYLHGKNVRERAMSLISIAHPKFREWLIEEARKENLIFRDQKFIPGYGGIYPEEFELTGFTRDNLEILIRPVKISDEPLLKEFFYALSDKSLYRRFMSSRTDMHHDRLQDFCVIDYTKEMVILAVVQIEEKKEIVAGVGQYAVDQRIHTAEGAVVVRDDFQNKGVASEIIKRMTQLARRQGLLGMSAELLVENAPVQNLIDKLGYEVEKWHEDGIVKVKTSFK